MITLDVDLDARKRDSTTLLPCIFVKKKKNECQQTECLNRAPGHGERQKRKRKRKEKKRKEIEESNQLEAIVAQAELAGVQSKRSRTFRR
jgi:hypothetical protein